MKDFKKYAEQAREDFAYEVSKYTVENNLDLRTKADSLLIAFDQAVAKALIIDGVSKRTFRFSGMHQNEKFIKHIIATDRETAIAYFETENPNLTWRTTTDIW